jgi:hypothetical protein
MGGKLIVRSGDKARTSSGGLWKNCLMDRFLWTCLSLSIAVMMWAGDAFAHHGGSEYDLKTTTTVEGTITEFRFVNPHVQILFESKDEKGNVLHWSCEAPDPAMLVRQGWSREMLKPGDHVTFVGHPAKSGAKVIVLQKLTLPDGRVMEAKGAAQ